MKVKINTNQMGFTLVEVMVSVAVVAILLAVGLPYYRDYVVRGQVDRCFKYITPARMTADAVIMSNNGSTDAITGAAALGLSIDTEDCEGGVEVRVNNSVVEIEGSTGEVSMTWRRAAVDGVWDCSATDVALRPDTCL